MQNKRPPRHRAAHQRGDAHRLALFHKFEKAFAPRQSAWGRGYDGSWQQLRKQHLASHPFCSACADEGVTRIARVVDHIQSLRERPDLRLDPINLQSLCWPCHNRKTNKYDRGFGIRPRRKPGPLPYG
jgi:5-methylcytosine-specific restriction endonuclease McrA